MTSVTPVRESSHRSDPAVPPSSAARQRGRWGCRVSWSFPPHKIKIKLLKYWCIRLSLTRSRFPGEAARYPNLSTSSCQREETVHHAEIRAPPPETAVPPSGAALRRGRCARRVSGDPRSGSSMNKRWNIDPMKLDAECVYGSLMSDGSMMIFSVKSSSNDGLVCTHRAGRNTPQTGGGTLIFARLLELNVIQQVWSEPERNLSFWVSSSSSEADSSSASESPTLIYSSSCLPIIPSPCRLLPSFTPPSSLLVNEWFMFFCLLSFLLLFTSFLFVFTHLLPQCLLFRWTLFRSWDVFKHHHQHCMSDSLVLFWNHCIISLYTILPKVFTHPSK